MNKQVTSQQSLTDWQYIDALADAEIDLSDCPEVSQEQFARAVVRKGLKPVSEASQVTLQLDADVLAWFRAQGRDYQARINALLRAYMEAHEGHGH